MSLNPWLPYHPWDERYISPNEWLIFMVNVGKYTSRMDAMGMTFHPNILAFEIISNFCLTSIFLDRIIGFLRGGGDTWSFCRPCWWFRNLRITNLGELERPVPRRERSP